MRSNNFKFAYVALFFAAVMWGATAPIMKMTLEVVPVFTLAFIRFGSASVLMFPLVFKKLAIRREDVKTIFFGALCGITFNISLFFFGLKLTSALNAGILIASTPIFTFLFAHIFLKEKLTRNFIYGGLIGLMGIMVIIGKDLFKDGMNISPIGDVLILLATIFFVSYETISKKLFKSYNALVITFYSFLFGSLSLVPFVIWESQKNIGWVNQLSVPVIAGIIYGIVFSSFLAYSFWEFGLSKITESKVGFFLYFSPIASTITAVVILSEKINSSFLIGAILILLGIFIAEGYVKHFSLKSKIPHTGVPIKN